MYTNFGFQEMTVNTILSKSIDIQTIENPLQSLQEKTEEKQK